MDLPPRIPGLTLLRRIGSGATADVFAARRDIDAWRCAVKVMRVPDPADRARIRREAAVLSSVRLPHLIHLHDAVALADGRMALVLDLVEGGCLADVLDQRGHFKPAEVAAVLGPLFATLDQLHQRGIVHGDVSTSNVLLTPEGAPRLSDLGAARLIGDGPGEVCATPEFVAPEVLGGGRPTAAADVHAAGAVGWHLLAGRPVPPWPSRPPLGEAVPGIPGVLAALIDDCVNPDPAKRPTAADAAARIGTPGRPDRLELPSGSDLSDRLTLRIRGATGLQEVDEPPGRHRSGLERSRARKVVIGIPAAVIVLAAAVVGLSQAVAASRGHAGGVGALPSAADASESSLVAAPPAALSPAARSSTGSSITATPNAAGSGLALPGGAPADTSGADGTVDPSLLSPSPSPSPPLAGRSGSAPRAAYPDRDPPAGDPDRDPVRTLVTLADARAAALMSRDARALGKVHTRGSAGLAADLRLLGRLREAGYRYRGLRYRVVDAAQVEARGDQAVVTARIDTKPFVVVDSAGGARTRPATHGARMRFKLVNVGNSSWRISSMQAV